MWIFAIAIALLLFAFYVDIVMTERAKEWAKQQADLQKFWDEQDRVFALQEAKIRKAEEQLYNKLKARICWYNY